MLRGCLTESVIQNLEIDSDYYKKVDLVVSLEETKHWEVIEGFRRMDGLK